MDNPLIGDLVGIIGVFLIVIAYILMQLNQMDPKKTAFSLLNALGAVLILISLLYDWNLASFIMEIIWISLSLYGIYKAQSSSQGKKN